MILRSGLEAPLSMIRNDIANTIRFIVHMNRGSDGKRRVVEVTEVIGRDGDDYTVREIFKWSPQKGFYSTGNVPLFVQNPTSSEMQLTAEFFDANYEYKSAG